MLAQPIVTVQLTPKQYDMLLQAFEAAKARDLRISDWTGETVEEIEARYQLPADDLIDDMVNAFFTQQSVTATV